MKTGWKKLCDEAENLVVSPAFVLAIPWLSGNEKVLLMVLAKNSDEFEPGFTKLMNDTGMPKCTILRALQRLDACGVITREPNGNGKRTHTKINYETLTGSKMRPVAKCNRMQNETGTGSKMRPVTGSKMRLQPKKEPNKQPKKVVCHTPPAYAVTLAKVWIDRIPRNTDDMSKLINEWGSKIESARKKCKLSVDDTIKAITFAVNDPYWQKQRIAPSSLANRKNADDWFRLETFLNQSNRNDKRVVSVDYRTLKHATKADHF